MVSVHRFQAILCSIQVSKNRIAFRIWLFVLLDCAQMCGWFAISDCPQGSPLPKLPTFPNSPMFEMMDSGAGTAFLP
jgi:hypothetical protein